MKVQLKNIEVHYPSEYLFGGDISEYKPESSAFRIYFCLIVGPKDGPGEETFYLNVVSTDWIKQELERYPLLNGRHYLIMDKWDYKALMDYIDKYLQKCTGETWGEVAEKVSRLGLWEFEDYSEN